MHSLWIVQWNSTRRDHLGKPGGVFGSGPVIRPTLNNAWIHTFDSLYLIRVSMPLHIPLLSQKL